MSIDTGALLKFAIPFFYCLIHVNESCLHYRKTCSMEGQGHPSYHPMGCCGVLKNKKRGGKILRARYNCNIQWNCKMRKQTLGESFIGVSLFWDKVDIIATHTAFLSYNNLPRVVSTHFFLSPRITTISPHRGTQTLSHMFFHGITVNVL